MAEFLRALANVVIIAVTILSVVAILLEKLAFLTALILLAILLFMGFIALIIYQINKLERRIIEIEQKFKRADDLKDIRSDVKALKLMLLKRR